MGTDSGSALTAAGGYTLLAAGNNYAGFQAIYTNGGSSSTYWCDLGGTSYAAWAYFPQVGGQYNQQGYCGIYAVVLAMTSAQYSASRGSRLAYRGGHAVG